MTFAPARGTALRTHVARWRFGSPPVGRRPTSFDVVEVRRLLRTDASLREIAIQLSVKEAALRRFIRQRNICNLTDRKKFISLQESLRKEGLAE